VLPEPLSSPDAKRLFLLSSWYSVPLLARVSRCDSLEECTMKCVVCGAEMTTQRENYRSIESGCRILSSAMSK
jgi:hypothetical protein